MLEYLSDWKLYFVLFFPLVVIYYWKNARIFYYGFQFDGPFAWPIFGNTLKALGNSKRAMEVLFDVYENYKTPGRLYIGHKLHVCLAKPEHIEIVLNSPHAFAKADLYKFSKIIFGDGLLSAPVPKWKRNRKLIIPVFNVKNLSGFISAFAEHAEELNKNLEDYLNNGYFDVYPVVHKFFLAILCETNLGIQLKDLPDEGARYAEAVKGSMYLIFKRMISVWLHLDLVFHLMPISKKLYEYRDYMIQLSENIISSRLSRLQRRDSIYAETNIVSRNKSFLDHLLELSKKEKGFSKQQIIDEVITMAIAGTDSTSNTISFTLMLLGMNRDIQEKVYEELLTIFGETDRPVEYDDLAKMDLLERIIKESLRLFPAGGIIVRKLEEDINLDSYLIPKGSNCMVYVYYIHRRKELWENPLKFDPDRFLPENAAKRHPYSFLPFSVGPRNCIGLTYAMFALKSTLSTILRKFQVFTPYKSVEEIKVMPDMVTRAIGGYKVSLKRRPIK